MKVKRVLVETLEKRCDLGVYPVKYDILDHLMEDIERLGTLSRLVISLY